MPTYTANPQRPETTAGQGHFNRKGEFKGGDDRIDRFSTEGVLIALEYGYGTESAITALEFMGRAGRVLPVAIRPEPLEGLYRCSQCGDDKPARDYGKDERNTGRDGLKSVCKACCTVNENKRSAAVRRIMAVEAKAREEVK